MLNVDENVTFVKFYIVPLINGLFYDLMVKVVIVLFLILNIGYNGLNSFVKKLMNKLYYLCVYSRLIVTRVKILHTNATFFFIFIHHPICLDFTSVVLFNSPMSLRSYELLKMI